MEYNEDLVRQAKAGNAHAFARLYEMIYQDLYRFALYTLKNVHDAEDTVSDTVVDAFRQIQSLQHPEAFRAWMFQILTNKCKMKLKSYIDKTAELPEELAVSTPDLSEQADVRNAFFALDPEDRLILSMNLFCRVLQPGDRRTNEAQRQYRPLQAEPRPEKNAGTAELNTN